MQTIFSRHPYEDSSGLVNIWRSKTKTKMLHKIVTL